MASSRNHTLRTRLLSIAYLVLAGPAVFLAVSSVFAFDAPGSNQSPLTIAFALSLLALPPVFVVSALGVFVCSFGNPTRARTAVRRFLTWLPVANVALFLIVFALIQTVCGGSFVCRL